MPIPSPYYKMGSLHQRHSSRFTLVLLQKNSCLNHPHASWMPRFQWLELLAFPRNAVTRGIYMALEGHTRQSPWKKVAWIPYNPSPKFGGDQNHLGGLGKLAQNFQLLCHRKEPWISCFYSTWLTANRRIPGIYSNIVPVYLFFWDASKWAASKWGDHPNTQQPNAGQAHQAPTESQGRGYGMQAPMTFTPKPSSSMLPSILGRIGVKGGVPGSAPITAL